MVGRLSFLHTVESNIGPFDAAAVDAGFDGSHHAVRSDLLAKATDLGGIDAELAADVEDALQDGLEKADLVFLTCSSIGSVADQMHAAGQAVLRTDQVLADAVISDALEAEGSAAIAVLVVAPTSVEPTTALFKARQEALSAERITIDVHLVPKVWDHFLEGDADRYISDLSEAIERFPVDNPGYSHLALGQASMAKAVTDEASDRGSGIWTIPSATQLYLSDLKAV